MEIHAYINNRLYKQIIYNKKYFYLQSIFRLYYHILVCHKEIIVFIIDYFYYYSYYMSSMTMPFFMHCYMTLDRFHLNLVISAHSKTKSEDQSEGIISASLFWSPASPSALFKSAKFPFKIEQILKQKLKRKLMDNWVWHKTIFKDGIHFLHWMFLFNIHVTANVWNCTLLLLQEVSLVDAVVLKAAIVLGDSPWLGLNHRACCYPESTMKRLLQPDSRMRSTELGMGSMRGCGKETMNRGKKEKAKKKKLQLLK